MSASLGIVIVNYRTPGLVVDCLGSLAPEVTRLAGARAVVVDNASGDGSAEAIAAAIRDRGWGGWAQLLAHPENGGFSAGNNAGIRLLAAAGGLPDWILLLNPDTLVRPGALDEMLRFGAERPAAGIVGAALFGADGAEAVAAFRFHTAASELLGALDFGPLTRRLARWEVPLPASRTSRRVDWVSGAAMMVRREVFDSVGLMDEGYFLYYEETDLCRRAARAGWECWSEPAAEIVHLEGQSTGASLGKPGRRVPGYALESRRRYFTKNHGRAYAVLADLAWLVGYLGYGLQRLVAPARKPARAPRLLSDFLRNSSLLVRRGR